MAVLAPLNIKIFQGSMPQIPLESSRFGRGSGLRPLNFRTQVYSLCTQVQTAQGKTLELQTQQAYESLFRGNKIKIDAREENVPLTSETLFM